MWTGATRILTLFGLALGLVLGTSSCGLEGGGFPVLNDPTPHGTVVAQGEFISVNVEINGTEVTGIAKVYLKDEGGYVVRLEGLSAPLQSGLILVVKTSSATVLQTGLRSPLGNQNYTVSASGTPTWSSVTIRSSQSDPRFADLGQAVF